MIIGFVGGRGQGKLLAAKYLVEALPGFQAMRLYGNSSLLDCPEKLGNVIIPDLKTEADAKLVRRCGRVVHIYGRPINGSTAGPVPPSDDIAPGPHDVLIGNHGAPDELHKAMTQLATAVVSELTE